MSNKKNSNTNNATIATVNTIADKTTERSLNFDRFNSCYNEAIDALSRSLVIANSETAITEKQKARSLHLIGLIRKTFNADTKRFDAFGNKENAEKEKLAKALKRVEKAKEKLLSLSAKKKELEAIIA